MMPVGSARRAVNHNITPSETLTWDTEWNNAQSESLVHHAQPTGTDWAAASTVELGYADDWSAWSIPAPIAHYPLAESSGTTANDVTGSNDGTHSGVTLGNSGGALGYQYPSYDGTDDYTSYPSGVIDTFETADAMTLAAWVYPTDLTSDGTIIAQFGNARQFLFYMDAGGTNANYRFGIEDSGGNQTFTGTDWDGATANTWEHVVATWDGSTLAVYLNGTQEDTASFSNSIASETEDGAIGAESGEVNSRNWVGRIQHAMLWDSALSAAQVDTLALNDSPTGFLTTPAKSSAAGLPTQLTTTSTLNGGSIDVVVHQDTNQDGTSDNSETVSLTGGTDETNSLSSANFTEDTDGADYWVDPQPSVTGAADDAPTWSKLAVTIG